MGGGVGAGGAGFGGGIMGRHALRVVLCITQAQEMCIHFGDPGRTPARRPRRRRFGELWGNSPGPAAPAADTRTDPPLPIEETVCIH